MNSKFRLMTVLAVFVFGALAIGCSGSRSLALGSTQQADISAYDIRGPDTITQDTQYRAFAIFDDGTEEDFTLALTWQSLDNTIVYFLGDQPGLAHVAGIGDVTIRAYETPIIGEKTITVLAP